MNQKLIDYILGGIIIALCLVVIFRVTSSAPSFGVISSSGVFRSTGTTNSSTIVNTTSTQVIPAGWTNYAQITNGGSGIVWCFLDNQTAASSSVALNSGIKIGAVSTTFSGEITVSFGPNGNIPYIGAINCIAGTSTKVGILYN